MTGKKFARSTSNRVLGGVLGGISNYFDWDANLVRLVFVILSVMVGFFPLPLAYVLAWMLIPDDKHLDSSDANVRRDVTPEDHD